MCIRDRPLVASSPKLKVKLSPSISSPENVITTLPSSSTVPLAALAVGASFTAFTVTVKACELENSPSVTVAVNDSLPLKLAVAEKLTVAPSTVAVISLPPDTEYVKPSPSISLPDSVVEPEPSSSKLTADTAASTGASFTGVTVNVTVAVAEYSPSLAVNVKLSSPLKLADGVYVARDPSTTTLPLVASSPKLKVKLSPSVSYTHLTLPTNREV